MTYILGDIFQVWPEVTDPEKFVYEDVAIAAYLLVRTHLIRGRDVGAGPLEGLPDLP